MFHAQKIFKHRTNQLFSTLANAEFSLRNKESKQQVNLKQGTRVGFATSQKAQQMTHNMHGSSVDCWFYVAIFSFTALYLNGKVVQCDAARNRELLQTFWKGERFARADISHGGIHLICRHSESINMWMCQSVEIEM